MKANKRDKHLPLLLIIDRLFLGEKRKATYINDYLKSVFSKPDTIDCFTKRQQVMKYVMSPIKIRYNRIAFLLLELEVQKSTGPDNISLIILKNFSEENSNHFCVLCSK